MTIKIRYKEGLIILTKEIIGTKIKTTKNIPFLGLNLGANFINHLQKRTIIIGDIFPIFRSYKWSSFAVSNSK